MINFLKKLMTIVHWESVFDKWKIYQSAEQTSNARGDNRKIHKTAATTIGCFVGKINIVGLGDGVKVNIARIPKKNYSSGDA